MKKFSYYNSKKKIEDLFREFRIEYKENSSKQFIFKKCPFCFTEKEKLYFDSQTTRWICFKCGEQGNIVTLISKLKKVPRKKAVEFLEEDTRRVLNSNLNNLVPKDLKEGKEEARTREFETHCY